MIASEPLRQAAEDIFRSALAESGFEHQAPHHIQLRNGTLSLGRQTYKLSSFRRVMLIAVGKAGVSMSSWIANLLAPELGDALRLQGVVVSNEDATELPASLRAIPGAHPLPNQHSLDAAQAILDLLSTADEHTLVLFLISGGASAMLDLPLSSNISLQDLTAFHRAVVHSGLPIAKMNTLRKHFSAVKGGRLALAAANAGAMATLLISDTPPGALDAIGSGPSLPDSSTVAETRAILDEADLWPHLPASVAEFFRSPHLPETPKTLPPAQVLVVLSSDTLVAAATKAAIEKGFIVDVDNSCDDWPSYRAAAYLLARLEDVPGDRVCLLSAGEVVVPISGTPGEGGRNQHFAIEMARLISRIELPVACLSAGSDGIDGNSPAAGAAIDNRTWDVARTRGLDPARTLATFNTYPLLQELGQAIHTGPTGNNLRDLRILLLARV